MKFIAWSRAAVFIVALVVPCICAAQDSASPSRVLFEPGARFHPVIGYSGMVATQEKLATEAAAKVLAEGGNAVDAAVAAAFTMAVTLPRAGNLGGGGFMLVHLAAENKSIAIDYREMAPMAATRDMFLDENGKVDIRKARSSRLATGVPGTVRGLALALEKHGTISLKRALQPAIQHAGNGFPVSEDLHNSLAAYQTDFARSHSAKGIFLKPDGSPWDVGELLVQKDLAASLRLIAQNGPDAFYKGKLAGLIAADMKKHGGLITKSDLAAYKPIIREPIVGTYRGNRIVSMPPPSSGGVHLIQMLNMLEQFPLRKYGHNSADSIHTMAETMKIAYADRSRYLGDPDFVKVPVKQLTSREYGRKRAETIDVNRARPSSEIAPGLEALEKEESPQTTHFSVIDKDGNVVANTYTLNFSYGTRIVAEGTGILLNNEMDDFSAKPGVPNAYGLIGGAHNAIEPGKRMLSSMTPTIVFLKNGGVAATGSPGGSRIITTVLQMIVNMVDFDMNVAEATTAPRFHHQWLPDALRVERGINRDTTDLLTARGHKIKRSTAMGSTQTVRFNGTLFFGFSDTRRPGALTLGLPKQLPLHPENK